MEIPLRYDELSAKAEISPSYANEIVNGRREPSRALAIHIFRKTGWRHPSITDLTEDQMRVLEDVDPWTPRTQDEAA
jgi:hypothetical protein